MPSRAGPPGRYETMQRTKRSIVTSSIAALVAAALVFALPSETGAKPRRFREPTVTTASYASSTVNAVRAEADWILSAQLPDGAIAHYTDKVAIWPYLSNFAALGLVRATKVTGDSRYLKAAWRWLEWYKAHQSPEGFVTDYTLSPDGVATSTGDMDSTDAYAGTFLYATWSAYDLSREKGALKRLRPGIDGAVRAIEATLDADGLTWAKPAWRVKYLMDQAEVYVGLRAAYRLRSALGDTTGAKRALNMANRLKSAVGALWNPAQQAYDWAVHDTGARDATTWQVFYPDSLQQVWAVAFGMTDSARSAHLTSTFTTYHPYWDQATSTWSIYGHDRTIDYWPIAGWALIRAGRSAEAKQGAANIRSHALASGRAWPYTPAHAGQLVMLLTNGAVLP